MNERTPHGPPPPAVEFGDPGDPQRSLILSEERLAVTTRQVPVATVRLERYQVTETRTFTVDVLVDRVRLVNDIPGVDPYVTDDPAADPPVPGPGRPSSTVAQWLVLSEERVVITKQMVPVERVGLAVTTLTTAQDVTDMVRVERVEVDTTGTAGPAS